VLLEVLDLVHVKEKFCPSKHGSGFLFVEGSDVGFQILDVSVDVKLEKLRILGTGGIKLAPFNRILYFPIGHHAFLLWDKQAGV
jgi:hypothetical protein